MIHEHLHLTRPLFIFDLETTGLNRQEARICEIGFQEWTNTGLKSEWRSLVNPGTPILNSKVHGITDSDVVLKCWKCRHLVDEHPHGFAADYDEADRCDVWRAVPKFEQIAARIAMGFSNCDFGGKNIRYDLEVMAAEMKRCRVEWSYASAYIVDAGRLEQLGDPRSLTHLVRKHLGKEMKDEAHTALGDVRWTSRLIAAQVSTYAILPPDLEALHKLQWPGWIDAEGKFKFEDGVAKCQFGKHRGVPMRNIPPSYYRWLTDADFSNDIKRLAIDALAGKFPVAKV